MSNDIQQFTLNIGDRVAFSAKFLRAIAVYTGPKPFLRGTVIEIQPFGSDVPDLVTVAWDARLASGEMGHAHEGHVLATNLTLVSRLAFDAA